MKVLILVPDTTPMPKALNILHDGEGGGVANYYSSIEKYFDHNVTYFTIGSRRGEKGRYKKYARLFNDNKNLATTIIKNKYDIIQINPSLDYSLFRDGASLAIAKSLNKKAIVFFHGWRKSFEKAFDDNIALRKIFIETYFKADAIIVLATEFKRKLEEWGYKKPIFLETTIVSDDVLSHNSINKEDKRNILFLSRIEKAKGVYETIDAFGIVKKTYKDITLTIAGDGAELNKAENYVKAENISGITFTGYLRGREKYKAFMNASVYIFPTFHGEGMPISVLEAMAYGLPVITRPVGGLKDFFQNEKMGFITDSKDANIYADFLFRLIENPALCKSIGEFNHEYSKEHFAASIVARRIKKVHEDIMGNDY